MEGPPPAVRGMGWFHWCNYYYFYFWVFGVLEGKLVSVEFCGILCWNSHFHCAHHRLEAVVQDKGKHLTVTVHGETTHVANGYTLVSAC